MAPAAFAQQSVTGTVADTNGEPLIGVTVQVVGATTGAVTNIDGKYMINAPEDGEIRFSYTGMKTLVEAVSGRSNIDITMDRCVCCVFIFVCCAYMCVCCAYMCVCCAYMYICTYTYTHT
ncbi:MAG: carboxypeptidase-like regulatory domain-containing protein, partial [Saprospiraceae bacterium]|nr:carboxypeptidase-like regulatory domain-containing protein [Saprospiraceae bacterium]